jgi:tetratricopeptide (TPR) repeat protein
MDRRQIDRRAPRDEEERDEFEEDPERAAEMTAHLGEVWHGKGKDLFDRHEYEDARRALKMAVEIRPDIAAAWFLLASIESMKGEEGKALSLLGRAVQLEPHYKEKARTHSAFKKYRGDADFDKMTK